MTAPTTETNPTGPLQGRRVLVLSSNSGAEAAEISRPIEELRAAGATVTVAAPETGVVTTLVLDADPGPEVPVDTTHDSIDPAEVDALVLPGGTLNADQLRADDTARAITQAVAAAGKPVAAICHAPWLLVDTGLAEGARLTSVPTIRPDLVNAGAAWEDAEVIVDDSRGYRLITSRTPDDLDAFIGAITDALT